MRQSLMLVGSYPPPYGGCSVHMERLREALRADFDVSVIDLYGARDDAADPRLIRCGRTRPSNYFRALRALRGADNALVHFHVAGMDAFLLAGYPMLAVLPAATSKVLTIHSGSFVARFERGPAWRRAVLRDLLRRFDRVVTVSDAQRSFLERLGITPQKLQVVPAFLPPVATESPRARAIFESMRSCPRIVIASGCGLPHYGFHIVLDALDLAKPPEGGTGVVFCTYDSYDEPYMSDLSARLHKRGAGTIVRDLAPGEFAWLLERCSVYVRATDRDGDAVALREASYYGKTVVASDCVARPTGALCFRTGDAASLARVLDETHDGLPSSSGREAVDTLGALRSVYASALAGPRVGLRNFPASESK